jgi:TonB family protein
MATGFAQPPESSLAHLRAGEALLTRRNLQDAAIEFHKALTADHRPAWTVVWAHIDLGLTFDLTGLRERAVVEYQLAIDTKDDMFGAQGYATEFLLKPPAADAPKIPRDLDDRTIPRILSGVEPEYSAEALLARLEGIVLVAVSVAPDGSIADLQVLKSLGLGLDEAALNAVARWKFAPGTAGGQPVPMVTQVPINFRLPSRIPGWHVKKIQFAEPNAAARPVLTRTNTFVPLETGSELAEEALIDTAISRFPDATISMEIDAAGNPSKIAVNDASLPIWGADAIRALAEWRFRPGSIGQIPVAVPCVIELDWFAP